MRISQLRRSGLAGDGLCCCYLWRHGGIAACGCTGARLRHCSSLLAASLLGWMSVAAGESLATMMPLGATILLGGISMLPILFPWWDILLVKVMLSQGSDDKVQGRHGSRWRHRFRGSLSDGGQFLLPGAGCGGLAVWVSSMWWLWQRQ